MTASTPFDVQISDDAVRDLTVRLERTRLPRHPFATDWSTGTDPQVLAELVSYWRDEFDWRTAERRLNNYQHFTTTILGDALHYVSVQAAAPQIGAGTNATSRAWPIVLLHGWPGSFIEHLRSAQRLAQRGYDVVVPSLPGFGFSELPKRAGLSNQLIAERIHALMQAIGHPRYGVQGGDIGAGVAGQMASRYPDAVVGLHLNFPARFGTLSTPPSAAEQAYTERMAQFREAETGYSHMHRTKPQTIGAALNDSPAGLLSWILEKFWAWSDHGDDLWQTFFRDDILANVCVYWFTETITSSMRTYQANAADGWNADSAITVPVGYANYPAEPWRLPRTMLEHHMNLVRYRDMPRGGHFAALEQPQLFANDVADFFDQVEVGI